MFDTTQTSDGLPATRRSAAAITVDNLLRRRLRVSNPRSANDIAEGLRRAYTTESQALERESSGLPVVRGPLPGLPPVASGSTSVEVEQAVADVDRDLTALTGNSQLKDIEAELDGWSQAIRASIDEGLSAARLALDPRSRDRAFGARRVLGDYARMARLIGTVTPTLGQPYRRLAQSLDEVAAVILVVAGEALAALGLGSGRALLPAPASELSARRDAVLAALRGLTGATENAFEQDAWPYGLHGLREALRRLEVSGHSDLRALLDENTLAQTLDELVDRASTITPRRLRALSATAQVTVQRLQRLIAVLSAVQRDSDPETPAVSAFLLALQLLVDGFIAQTGAYRLLYIARPPIVFYGLYGLGGPDPATRRLLDVVALRGRLAELLDCYLGCDCCGPENECQAVLDKLLYSTDRAIDLLIVGTDPAGKGEPEQRAAAHGFLIREFVLPRATKARPQPNECLTRKCSSSTNELASVLARIATHLLEVQLEKDPLAAQIAIDANTEGRIMGDELCLLAHAESHWQHLVSCMTPSCTTWERIHAPIQALHEAARARLGVGPCPEPEISLPPTIETSTAGIASGRLPSGERVLTLKELRDPVGRAIRNNLGLR